MNYEVRAAPRFERRLKQLAKNYRRIGQDLAPLIGLLAVNPRAGDSIPGFGDTVFKTRLASSDNGAVMRKHHVRHFAPAADTGVR